MASLNKVMIIGNLGRDPEIRQAGEYPVADFSVACSEKFKGRDSQQQERVEWVNVVAWGRLAEISRDYLRKGSSVYVEGKLSTRSWTDKTSGAKRYATEVVAASLLMLDKKPRDDQQSGGYGYAPSALSSQPATFVGSPADDDLPF